MRGCCWTDAVWNIAAGKKGISPKATTKFRIHLFLELRQFRHILLGVFFEFNLAPLTAKINPFAHIVGVDIFIYGTGHNRTNFLFDSSNRDFLGFFGRGWLWFFSA